MGFFDEDNKKFEGTLLASVLILVVYVASYWVIRESHTTRAERDGCPSKGCEEVRFPRNSFYVIYAPIYLLDKYTDVDTEFVLLQ